MQEVSSATTELSLKGAQADSPEHYSMCVEIFCVELRILALPLASIWSTTVRVAVARLALPSMVDSISTTSEPSFCHRTGVVQSITAQCQKCSSSFVSFGGSFAEGKAGSFTSRNVLPARKKTATSEERRCVLRMSTNRLESRDKTT